jgi:hypothetical protein
MTMTDDEARAMIVQSVRVTRADVAAAKAYLMSVKTTVLAPPSLVTEWVAQQGFAKPKVLDLASPAIEVALAGAGRALALTLAGHYAVWELVSAGELHVAGTVEKTHPSIGWRTDRFQSGWDFEEFTYSQTGCVVRPLMEYRGGLLGEPELYIREVAVPDLHPGIAEALMGAIRCFRFDLLNPAVAMLGAASEGLWVEVARALVEALPAANVKVSKVGTRLKDPSGLPNLIMGVIQVLEDTALSGQILESADVRLAEVRTSEQWSNTVREARNVLHWGVSAPVPNSFEKVSILLLSAVPQVRRLYAIVSAARAATRGTGPPEA